MASLTNGVDWSDAQNDLVVADYFAMHAMSMAGEPFVKSHRYVQLAQVIGKSHKAVERKHQNISAVLERLGVHWLKGLAPLRNFQDSLIDAVSRHLSAQPDVVVTKDAVQSSFGLHETRPFLSGPVPTLLITPAPMLTAEDRKSTEALERLVRKFDPVARDSRNRQLGFAGEELVLHHERARLNGAGRDDLARKVEWTSQERGDGAGYDIASFAIDGTERLIEVKTTNGPAKTPFFLSENERLFSEERPDAFRLMRLHDFATQPAGFEIQPPLSTYLALQPISYRAALQ